LNEKNVAHSPLPFSRLSGIGFDSKRHRISLDGQRSVGPFTAFDMDCIGVLAATFRVSSNVSAVCCHTCAMFSVAPRVRTIQINEHEAGETRAVEVQPHSTATSIAAGTSDQKSAPAMPITLIVAADNFLTRHHAFMRYKFCWVDAGQPRPPRPDRTLSRGTKGHQVAPDRSRAKWQLQQGRSTGGPKRCLTRDTNSTRHPFVDKSSRGRTHTTIRDGVPAVLRESNPIAAVLKVGPSPKMRSASRSIIERGADDLRPDAVARKH
jgi:hypothetical protein